MPIAYNWAQLPAPQAKIVKLLLCMTQWFRQDSSSHEWLQHEAIGIGVGIAHHKLSEYMK